MNKSRRIVLEDARNRLGELSRDSEWYYRKSRECEHKIIALKEMIAELEAMND